MSTGPARTPGPRRTPYRPYGGAAYHREILLRSEPGRARGELVDDFHHFRATILHDGERVREAIGESVRHPWTTCAGAAQPLRRLAGMALDASPHAAGQHTPRRAQCTHMFDAARLAIAAAARGLGTRRYQIAIPDRVEGRTRARLLRDGEALLEWQVQGDGIESPPPFAGHKIHGGGFADWALAALDPDFAEAVLILQRALVISMGRTFDLENARRADDMPTMPMGQCHTYTPGIVERGLRMIGTVRNFDSAEEVSAEIGRPAPDPPAGR